MSFTAYKKYRNIALSQVKPGLRILGKSRRRFGASVLAVVAGLFFLQAAIFDPSGDFMFRPPKAYAAMRGAAAGIEKDKPFTNAEQRSILRAVYKNPDNLVKLDGHGVKVVLEEPDAVRADLPTVVWQYRSEACVLDIYFQSETPDADLAPVVYYETRARKSGGDDKACMDDFVPTRFGPRMVSVSAFYKSYIQ